MYVHCPLFTTVERSLSYNEINHYLEVVWVLFYCCNTRKHNLSTRSCKITNADNFSYTFNENELLRSNKRQCLYLNNVIKNRKLTLLCILHYSPSFSLNQSLGPRTSMHTEHAVCSKLATLYKLNPKRAYMFLFI